jgi:5-methyltetrahydrofolate--homocysteine methyltransferase
MPTASIWRFQPRVKYSTRDLNPGNGLGAVVRRAGKARKGSTVLIFEKDHCLSLGKWSDYMDYAVSDLFDCILGGNKEGVEIAIREALDTNKPADRILFEAMIPAMDEVGKLYEKGEYFVPEMLVAARAMRAGLEVLRPYLVEEGVQPMGKVAIGTVKGDLHDIGKNLVAIMLEGGGFQILDLGVDVPVEKYIEAIQSGVDIVAMSALLTTTMPQMQITIEQLKQANLRDKVLIMIGGAPVTQAYADKIGADGYSSNASGAVDLARALMKR